MFMGVKDRGRPRRLVWVYERTWQEVEMDRQAPETDPVMC